MSLHQIIHVIPVRDGLVATIDAVHMLRRMGAAGMAGRALVRVGVVHRQRVLVIVVFMVVMQMSIMQIVHVTVMLNPCMAASGSVDVNVVTIGVYRVMHTL